MTTDTGRRNLIKLLGAGALGLGVGGVHAQARPGVGKAPAKAREGAPNIIFVMTDDQSQDALSIYGNKILKTPNMDRIGNEGIRFTESFVTTSVCAPSRASYLTGLYAYSHGVTSNGEEPGWYDQMGLRPDQVTYPMLLQQAGYHTAVVGKWHIKSMPRGFDHWAILRGQGSYYDPQFIVNGAPVRFRGHTDDVIGDQAMAYLRQRPTDRPFCLCFQFKAPHGPWESDTRFMDEFKDAQIPIPVAFEGPPEGAPVALSKATMDVADLGNFKAERRPPQVDTTLPPDERAHANLQALVRNYYRALLGVDENLGRVLDYLDEEGLAENTIVVYTSDNGYFLGQFGFFDKRMMYEPSLKVPTLLRWPKRIKAGQVDSEHMVLNIDMAPTLLSLAGVEPPDWMQGESWTAFIDDGVLRQDVDWREDFLYEWYEYPAVHCARKHRGVRTERWKLIHFWEEPDEWAFYDLEEDPDELVNLIDDPAHAGIIAQLKERITELRAEIGDVDPPGYEPPERVTGKCPA